MKTSLCYENHHQKHDTENIQSSKKLEVPLGFEVLPLSTSLASQTGMLDVIACELPKLFPQPST